MRKPSNDNPEPKFTAWSDSVERYIRGGIVILAILLCLSQLVLQFPAARYRLTTTDVSEGVPFPGLGP